MWLEEIVLDGFKSYATRTVISGFDPFFNAITGLNGSGKSNILDAICFVLGITNLSQVRVSNLQELVYKHGQAGVTKASVTLVFNNQDKTSSPVGYEQYDQITVTRQVIIGGRNKYLINGHNAQVNRVQNLFHSVQLNVNNPHFLIMQGRITKVLNMKPPEILSMVEEAAGTRMFEMKKANALKTIEKKDKKVVEINRVLNEEITPTLEKLRGERTHYMQWLANNTEIEKLERVAIAYEYQKAADTLQKSAGDLSSLQEKLSALREQTERHGNAVLELKDQIAKLVSKREKKMDTELKQLEAEGDRLGKELVKHTQAQTHKQETLDAETAQKTATLKNAADQRRAIEAKEKELTKQQQLLTTLEADTKALQALVAELQAGLQAGAAVGLAADADGVKTFTDLLMDAKREAATAAADIKSTQLKAKHLAGELAEARKVAKTTGKESSDLQQTYDRLAKEIADLQTALKKLPVDEAALSKRIADAKAAQSAAQQQREKVDSLQSRLGEFSFDFADPAPGFDRKKVHGLVANLIKVLDPTNCTALEVAAGGRLYNVIVDTEQTGKLLLDKGKLKKRVTIIPLNKITSKPIPERAVQRATQLVGGDKCAVALSLVGFDEQLDAAMQYVFGGTLVCSDPESAKLVAFDKDVRARSVTLEGDLYDPSGTLTGGSRAAGSSVLKRLSEMHDAQAELEKRQTAHMAAAKTLEALQADADKLKKLQSQLELKTHELQLLETRLKDSPHHVAQRRVQELEQKTTDVEAALAALSKKEKDAEIRVRDTEERIRNFENQKGGNTKETEKQVAANKTKLAAALKKSKAQQQEVDRLTLELEELRAELRSLEQQATTADATIAQLTADLAKTTQVVLSKKAEYDAAQADLSQKKASLVAADKSIQELETKRERHSKDLLEAEGEQKKIEHKIARFHKDQKDATGFVQQTEAKYPWIATEKHNFGKQGTDFDFRAKDPQKAVERIKKLQDEQNKLSKSINKKVMSMFEKAEAEYQSLVEKKKIIENDKTKLLAVIDELDEKKNEALKKTYEKVNKDFGSIFSTLLPGTQAKLDPPEGKGVLDGLEVKVAFGGTWKESLTELSGGQRSLLALSLILALLLFKPAPMYILDEIDAALDLSHTQNIGQMLRTHFARSQFIIVSLKEGMFNNANVLFKTKFVDGVSTVTRSTPNAAGAAAGGGGGAKSRGQKTH